VVEPERMEDERGFFAHTFYRTTSPTFRRWTAIEWPPGERIISDRDRLYPDFPG